MFVEKHKNRCLEILNQQESSLMFLDKCQLNVNKTILLDLNRKGPTICYNVITLKVQ